MITNNQLQSVGNNSIANNAKRTTFSMFMQQDSIKSMINNVIGGKNADRFITSIVSAVSQNGELQKCEQSSILSCALLGAGLNLTPSPQLGQFYMVPFKDNKTGTSKAQFILGYKGYIQLAIRSGYYKKMIVLAIKEGELKNYDALNEEIEVELIADEVKRENAKTIGYYSMFEYSNGFRKAIYWSRAKMEQHAITYSKGYAAKKGYTFWEKDFNSMAYKTLLRHLISRWGIMSIEMQSAIEADNKGINKDGSYIDMGGDDGEIVAQTINNTDSIDVMPEQAIDPVAEVFGD